MPGARLIHEGDGLDLSKVHIRAFVIPGHTAGSAAYLIGGALFLGDSATIYSHEALRAAPWVFSDDQAQNVASLRRLGKLLGPGEVQALVGPSEVATPARRAAARS